MAADITNEHREMARACINPLTTTWTHVHDNVAQAIADAEARGERRGIERAVETLEGNMRHSGDVRALLPENEQEAGGAPEVDSPKGLDGSGPPASTPQAPGDWPEDFEGENGQYQNRCVKCDQAFVGHKRRHTCKVCSEPEALRCVKCGRSGHDAAACAAPIDLRGTGRSG